MHQRTTAGWAGGLVFSFPLCLQPLRSHQAARRSMSPLEPARLPRWRFRSSGLRGSWLALISRQKCLKLHESDWPRRRFGPRPLMVRPCPLGMTASTRSLVSSVCSSFLIPLLGCWSSAAFFVQEAGRPYASTPRQTGRRCGAFSPKRSAGSFPSDGTSSTCRGHWPTRGGSKSCSPMRASGTSV